MATYYGRRVSKDIGAWRMSPWQSDSERPRELRLCCPKCGYVTMAEFPREDTPTEAKCKECGCEAQLVRFLLPPRHAKILTPRRRE